MRLGSPTTQATNPTCQRALDRSSEFILDGSTGRLGGGAGSGFWKFTVKLTRTLHWPVAVLTMAKVTPGTIAPAASALSHPVRPDGSHSATVIAARITASAAQGGRRSSRHWGVALATASGARCPGCRGNVRYRTRHELVVEAGRLHAASRSSTITATSWDAGTRAVDCCAAAALRIAAGAPLPRGSR